MNAMGGIETADVLAGGAEDRLRGTVRGFGANEKSVYEKDGSSCGGAVFLRFDGEEGEGAVCYAATGLSMRGVAAIARFSPRSHPGTRKDLTGSNLWPGRSGCIAMILHAQSSRLEPHPRGAESGCVREAERKPALPAAPKRRGVGLCARSGEEAAQRLVGQVGLYCDDSYTRQRPDSSRPQAARSRVDTRGAEWKRHSRLSGLSSRCGGVVSVRIRAGRHPGTIGDLTGSNLWPGRSCGRTIAPTRSNVQTRSAPKR